MKEHRVGNIFRVGTKKYLVTESLDDHSCDGCDFLVMGECKSPKSVETCNSSYRSDGTSVVFKRFYSNRENLVRRWDEIYQMIGTDWTIVERAIPAPGRIVSLVAIEIDSDGFPRKNPQVLSDCFYAIPNFITTTFDEWNINHPDCSDYDRDSEDRYLREGWYHTVDGFREPINKQVLAWKLERV